MKFLKYFHVLPNCYSHDYVILLQKINTFFFYLHLLVLDDRNKQKKLSKKKEKENRGIGCNSLYPFIIFLFKNKKKNNQSSVEEIKKGQKVY